MKERRQGLKKGRRGGGGSEGKEAEIKRKGEREGREGGKVKGIMIHVMLVKSFILFSVH